MPDTKPTDVSQVQDRRPKIAGLLPRNAQQRVLGGIAVLMILVMMFSGRKPPAPRAAAVPGADPAAVDPNQARIQEYRARLDEETRKLAAEEAGLVRTQQALGVRTGESPVHSSADSVPTARSGFVAAEPYRPGAGEYRPAPEKSWAELDREKREYQALFASNIALTYRRPPDEAAIAYSVGAAPPQSRETPLPRAAAGKSPAANSGEYRLLEGTVIETVLTNRLDSSLAGPVNCMVTTPVYSHDRQTLLIPQGTRVLGEARKLESYGEQRLAVFFHRLVLPDGFTVSLDKFQGLNQIGETGLRDQVNHHYLQIFGVSLAIGAVAGLGQASTRYSLDESGAAAYEQGVTNSLSQSAMHILDRYLNVLPTFTIREGYRVKIYLSQDLRLPAYDPSRGSYDE